MSQSSVIIPCYNGEAYLPEALASVAGQTARPLEILVIDDGSRVPVGFPDNWHGPELRLIRTENRGLAAARNLGVREARGEFVAFLDCDDWWEPTKLELQQTLLNQHPEAVATYTQCVDQPGCYGFGPYPPEQVTDADFALMLWYHAFFPPSAVLARRQAVVDVGFFREGMLNGEDVELWFRLLKVGRFLQVPVELTYYRQHAGQLTGNVVRKLLGSKQARSAMISDHQDRLVEYGLPAGKLWDAYRQDILAVYFRRDFAAARVLLWDYCRDHPRDWKMWAYTLMTLLPASWIRRWRGEIAAGVGTQPGGSGNLTKRNWPAMLQRIKDVVHH